MTINGELVTLAHFYMAALDLVNMLLTKYIFWFKFDFSKTHNKENAKIFLLFLIWITNNINFAFLKDALHLFVFKKKLAKFTGKFNSIGNINSCHDQNMNFKNFKNGKAFLGHFSIKLQIFLEQSGADAAFQRGQSNYFTKLAQANFDDKENMYL